MQQEIDIKVEIRFAQAYDADVVKTIIEEDLIKTDLDITQLDIARTNAHIRITTSVKASYSTAAIKAHIIHLLKDKLDIKYYSMKVLKLREEAEIYGNK